MFLRGLHELKTSNLRRWGFLIASTAGIFGSFFVVVSQGGTRNAVQEMSPSWVHHTTTGDRSSNLLRSIHRQLRPDLAFRMVKDISPDGPDNGSFPAALTVSAGKLFFRATNDMFKSELWTTDGTEEGTQLVKDIGERFGFPNDIAPFKNGVIFEVNEGSNFGFEPWFSDGSEEGTYLIKDIYEGPSGSFPMDFTRLGEEKVVFRAFNPAFGNELWVTDGTEEGTYTLDISPGDLSSVPAFFAEMADKVYFSASDPKNGRELWETDGTVEGTRLVVDIAEGQLRSSPQHLFVFANKLFFSADSNQGHGRELWISDGTAGGTEMLKDINEGSESSSPDTFAEAGGKLFFLADDGLHGRELWVTDGTEEGTHLVRDIEEGPDSSIVEFSPIAPIAFQGCLYFSADQTRTGIELWRSDGTEEGTVVVKDIRPGLRDSAIGVLVVYKGLLYFGARDPVLGNELWRTDGTEAGTELVADIKNPGQPENGGSFPRELTVFKGKLFFTASDGINGSELWVAE